ncbi:MAG: hypothetical protein ACK4K7_12150 [Allosphingosinicella sp.]|uniref:hypothetical protein n=1 Tax=Allosphingosinicella sp. TaxID=2823234 RepID=UPI00394CF539
MTFEAQAAAICEHAEIAFDTAPALPLRAPANDLMPADPEAGWATANPEKAMLFLFVTPRDCTAVDELLAL